MKPHVSKNRLETLATFLDALPPKRFNFALFGTGILKNEPQCKATGCALGWATAMPQFQRLGLYSIVEGDDMTVVMKTAEGSVEDFEAAMELFGLSELEAEVLFHPNTSASVGGEWLVAPSVSATPKRIAAHIRKFIKLKWPS